MSIPLDNLYHWVEGLAQHPVILYVFRPHGSKDIFDLGNFEDRPSNGRLLPVVICHDQEPLNFKLHQFDMDLDRLKRLFLKRGFVDDKSMELELKFYSYLDDFPKFKPNWLRAAMPIHDWVILLHSEQNSHDVEQFLSNGFRPVYYWCHAVIARDWYRFAKHDLRLNQPCVQKTFLVYCRDWMPTREYRLKFLDLLVSANLDQDCVISTQHINNQGVHLANYQVQDSRFAVDTQKLLCIPNNNSPSSASADYNVNDINTTAISVVLETVIDGSKIHLTEKILRPIACGHPFILVAGPGSLAYLRSYGFKTFNLIFDESYDQETDTVKRLEMVISTMRQVQQLTASDWRKINEIAEFNKQHFFSEEFINQVTNELTENLNSEIQFCLDNQFDTRWRWRKILRRTKLNLLDSKFKSAQAWNRICEIRKYRLGRSQNNPGPIITK
jgi:hypothetical protein